MSTLSWNEVEESSDARARRGASSGRGALYVVCSPCRRVGKTLLARLITDFYLSHEWPVAAFDLADEGPQLIDYLPYLTTIADIGSVPGQMALFDGLIADKDTAKVIDVSHRTFKDFFVIANKICFFEAARRRGIEPIILFLIDRDPKSVSAYSILQRWFPAASLLPVRNENVARGIPYYWDKFPNKSSVHVSLEIPVLISSSTRLLIDQPSFSFSHFQATPSIGLPFRLDEELRGFIKRVFHQVREIELCLKCDDVWRG